MRWPPPAALPRPSLPSRRSARPTCSRSRDAARRTRKSKARGGDKRMLPIRKMTEKFARNPALDADSDVAKRVYYLTEGRLRVDYHFGTNRITNSSRCVRPVQPSVRAFPLPLIFSYLYPSPSRASLTLLGLSLVCG
jgi:hypothetical protein